MGNEPQTRFLTSTLFSVKNNPFGDQMANETSEYWQKKLKPAMNASVTFRKGHISFDHSSVCCNNRSIAALPMYSSSCSPFPSDLTKIGSMNSYFAIRV